MGLLNRINKESTSIATMVCSVVMKSLNKLLSTIKEFSVRANLFISIGYQI